MQQLIATWLSAFCAFTGLVLHPAKICNTLLGPIPPKYRRIQPLGPTTHSDKTDLIVYDHAWVPISCPTLPDLLTLRYLGVQLDLRNKLASHTLLQQRIQRHLAHLVVQPGSPHVKIDYILFKLMPICLATALCANWTLRHYRQLDKPFSHVYRQLLCLPPTFPGDLLYIPQSSSGIGLPRFSDKAQLMKWESMMRCQSLGGNPRRSVDDLFARLPPECTAEANYLRTLSPPGHWPHTKLTTRSLVEWFSQAGLALNYQTENPTHCDSNIRTNTSLSDLAEDLQLWPSDIYSPDSNANLPPIRLVATDGSFEVQPRGMYDLLTPETELRRHGTGSGGIVFLPPGYSETNMLAPPNAVRICSKQRENGMNAFTWELATQLIALHFTKHQNPDHLVLTSDCTSAITQTNRALRTRNDQLMNARGGLLAVGCHEFADPHRPMPVNSYTPVPTPSETKPDE